MKTILLDNIIYSLQQFGGISAMWAILHKSLMCDNTMNLIVITSLLKETQVKVTTCMSGYEALELMETNKD